MGCDIYGSVEFRDAALGEGRHWTDWYSIINAGIILDRNYALFGSLFGVRNPTDFTPVVAGRGLPDNVSEEVRSLAEWEGNHSFTWISWDELQAVDWDETGKIYGTNPISRRDTLGVSGVLLLDLMKPLAERYGGQYVRWVAWFDNYS